MSRCSPRNMPLARSPFSLLLHSRCRTYKPPFPPRYPHPSPSYLLERTTRPPSWLVPSTLPLPSALTPSTSIPHLPPPTPPCPCLPLYKKDLSAPGLSRQGEHDGGLRASRAPPAPCGSGGRRTPKPLPARPRSPSAGQPTCGSCPAPQRPPPTSTRTMASLLSSKRLARAKNLFLLYLLWTRVVVASYRHVRARGMVRRPFPRPPSPAPPAALSQSPARPASSMSGPPD